ncbi:MAG TPA: hypothetical protein VGE67_00850 [Haloferula sp.]
MALWLSKMGYILWAQKQLSGSRTAAGSDFAELTAFLDEVRQRIGAFDKATAVAGILFAVCLILWLLAIRKRRALAERIQ